MARTPSKPSHYNLSRSRQSLTETAGLQKYIDAITAKKEAEAKLKPAVKAEEGAANGDVPVVVDSLEDKVQPPNPAAVLLSEKQASALIWMRPALPMLLCQKPLVPCTATPAVPQCLALIDCGEAHDLHHLSRIRSFALLCMPSCIPFLNPWHATLCRLCSRSWP